MSTPHDALFKFAFTDLTSTRSLLASLLPVRVVEQLDWATLRKEPGSFVDEHLRDRHCDLLFAVEARSKLAFVYVLLEHQSAPDPLMPLRMLRYLVKIWDRFLLDHPHAHTLPAVFPVVIHHGDRGWPHATELRDLIDLDPDLLRASGTLVPTFRFLLDDLAVLDENAIHQRALTALARAALLLLRNARSRTGDELASDLARWYDTFLEVLNAQGGASAFWALMRYTLYVNDIPDRRIQDFAQRLGPAAVEAIMTGAERLIKQGEDRGRAEGRTEGRAEGRAEIVLKLLELRFGPLDAAATRRISAASADDLDRFAERVITAAALEDVFG